MGEQANNPALQDPVFRRFAGSPNRRSSCVIRVNLR
jgi:hypothetical protein